MTDIYENRMLRKTLYILWVTVFQVSSLFGASYKASGQQLLYGNVIQIQSTYFSPSGSYLAMWNATYPNQLPAKYVVSAVPTGTNLPGIVDTYWIVGGGTVGTPVLDSSSNYGSSPITLQSFAFGTYMTTDMVFSAKVSGGSAVFGQVTTPQNNWTLALISSNYPTSYALTLKNNYFMTAKTLLSIQLPNNSWQTSYDPGMFSPSGGYSLWNLILVASSKSQLSAPVAPPAPFVLGATSTTLGTSTTTTTTTTTTPSNTGQIQTFETGLINGTTQATLSTQTFSAQINAMEGFITNAKTVYTGSSSPSSAVLTAYFQGSDSHGGLTYMYSSRNKTSSAELASLSTLLTSATTSVLLAASQKTTVNGWISQLAADQKVLTETTAAITSFETQLKDTIINLLLKPFTQQVSSMQALITNAPPVYTAGKQPSDAIRLSFFNGLFAMYNQRDIDQISSLKILCTAAVESILMLQSSIAIVQSCLTELDLEEKAIKSGVAAAALIQNFEMKVRDTILNLLQNPITVQIKLMTSLVKQSTIAYIGVAVPSDATMQSYYNGLYAMFQNRDSMDKATLTALSSLYQLSLRSKLLTALQVKDVKKWVRVVAPLIATSTLIKTVVKKAVKPPEPFKISQKRLERLREEQLNK